MCVCVCVCMCVCVCILYQYKYTPLHYAAYGGHCKIVETLVEAKADLCAQEYVSVLKETSVLIAACAAVRKRRLR